MRHGEEIRSRLDQRPTVAGSDAADGDAGDFEELGPPVEQIGGRAFRVALVLRARREECPEGDLVRPRLARFHGEVAAGVAGDADLRLAPQFGARVSGRAVVLPEMHPVGLQALGERDRIVDDEGHVMRRTDGLQRGRKAGSLVLVDTLHPELEGCDEITVPPSACGERALEPGGKLPADVERGDEVELGLGHGGLR